jgi:hypothetical protein
LGVTIHFEGRLRDEDAYRQFIDTALSFANEMEWSCREFHNDQTHLKRVRGEEEWDYVGLSRGVEISPHEACDPFRLEFDKDFYIQEFTKTQFAPIEIHVLIADFLRKNADSFDSFLVEDEGEFFETNDLGLLETHIENCNSLMEEYLAQPNKYYGPVRLEDGRIVDLMER